MRFHVLGPLQVRDDDRPVRVRGVRQAATLGYLLLHANEMVPVSRLIDALWPTRVPPTGRQVLHNAVFRLRGTLAAVRSTRPAELRRVGPGYALLVDEEALDLAAFRHLAGRGRAELRAGQWERASATLRRASRLWRGTALADLAEHGYDWPELRSLHDERASVLLDRVDADLALGRDAYVIGDLERLLEVDPLNEQVCGRLMRALYETGRQADALTLYRTTRSALIGQLGLEPSPPLRELEHAILNHDLAPVSAGDPVPGVRGRG
ncbi:AfsR/SARP family transcriptional regulator [Saccharothrix sp. Mg75]|uniref:AfsR/SARP family transcriptional regulator n=1 Tax=Saccharothrix sp. Mg75 TaxID=3445357 RepID=UPI003EED18F7